MDYFNYEADNYSFGTLKDLLFMINKELEDYNCYLLSVPQTQVKHFNVRKRWEDMFFIMYDNEITEYDIKPVVHYDLKR